MTPALDLPSVRARFPALVAHPELVHSDAPGGTQIVDSALDALRETAVLANANQHGVFATSLRVGQLCEDARAAFGAFLGSEPDSIVFGSNMTTLAFHLAHALDEVLATGGEVVCTRLDHDANVTPWLDLAERAGAGVRWVPITADGRFDEDAIADAITPRTRLVAFPAASNALGTIVDAAPFVSRAAEVGALTVMDAVHAAPHVPLDRRGTGVDVLLCSPYKFFGPHAGVMAADPALLERLRPDKVRPAPNSGAERWQTGTASFEAIAASAAAARYLADEVGFNAVVAHEHALATQFLEGLATQPAWTLHGPPTAEDRTPTFAITHAELEPQAVATRLAEVGVQVWSGHYYAVEPMRALGLLDRGGAVRIGFVHYHGRDDVERVLSAMAELA